MLEKGYEVHGIIRRSSSFNTARLEHIYNDPHVPANRLRLHYGELKPDGSFAKADESIDCANEPDHDGLCLLEQEVFLDAILHDRDLSAHMEDAVSSLRIVLAADEAFKTGRTVEL